MDVKISKLGFQLYGDKAQRIAEKLIDRCIATVGPLPTPCWIWLGNVQYTRGNYPIARVDGVTKAVHRVLYMLQATRVPDKGLELGHRCANPRCVNPSHVRPITHSQNVREGRHNRCNGGEQRALTAKQVRMLRLLRAANALIVRQEARKFGIDPNTVRKAASGKSYRHVQ